MQTVLAASSHLLSDDHVTSWHDLTRADQQETAIDLVSAVEMGSFMRADVSQSPLTIVVDYDNIGRYNGLILVVCWSRSKVTSETGNLPLPLSISL